MSSVPPSVEELAERLRPVRLVGEYEYRLAVPDTLLAERILAMREVPSTEPFKIGAAPARIGEGLDARVHPKFIIGADNRWLYQPSNATSYGRVQQNCTFTMIGPSTAACAAHCFYQQGSWISGGLLYLSAYNHGSTAGSAVFPNGSGGWYADTLTIPGGWVNGAGGPNWASQTASSHPGWDDDYAVLEFSPTRYPGYSTGWQGTEQSTTGEQRVVGYPIDKVLWSQWVSSISYLSTSGARYVHNGDIAGGESGGCWVSVATWRCTAIQSSQWVLSGTYWNEARRWDATTYSFFDLYGNWP